MSIAENGGEFSDAETISRQSWGDFSGRTGIEGEGNWYDEVFEDVKNILDDASDYMMFENAELPQEQVIDKYEDELKPEDGEYLEAELTSYPTAEGRFNILELEKGRIDDITIATTGYSFRPTVKTDEFPSRETERLVSVDKTQSDTYQIMWEE